MPSNNITGEINLVGNLVVEKRHLNKFRTINAEFKNFKTVVNPGFSSEEGVFIPSFSYIHNDLLPVIKQIYPFLYKDILEFNFLKYFHTHETLIEGLFIPRSLITRSLPDKIYIRDIQNTWIVDDSKYVKKYFLEDLRNLNMDNSGNFILREYVHGTEFRIETYKKMFMEIRKVTNNDFSYLLKLPELRNLRSGHFVHASNTLPPENLHTKNSYSNMTIGRKLKFNFKKDEIFIFNIDGETRYPDNFRELPDLETCSARSLYNRAYYLSNMPSSVSDGLFKKGIVAYAEDGKYHVYHSPKFLLSCSDSYAWC